MQITLPITSHHTFFFFFLSKIFALVPPKPEGTFSELYMFLLSLSWRPFQKLISGENFYVPVRDEWVGGWVGG